jgi:hypothetical protein
MSMDKHWIKCSATTVSRVDWGAVWPECRRSFLVPVGPIIVEAAKEELKEEGGRD